METTETSQKEWNEFREWETRKHQEFFLPYYRNNRFEVIEDFTDRFSPYDMKLKKDEIIYYVDEKARQRDYDDFIVEVFQCLKTGKIGWLYKFKTHYFYASWNNPENPEPSSAYWIDSKKLIDFLATNFDELNSVVSQKGYGLTYNKRVNWDDLLYLKIAEKII